MKNQFFLMIIFCLISNVAHSMSINLDEASKAKLIEQVKAENVKRGYWPSDVAVRLEQFYMMPGNNGSDTRYFVRAVGSYARFAQPKPDSEATPPYIVIGRGTQGSFRKEELESLGVRLPE
jgi:nitrous oxide reductase accessory protein NosL